ncbi:MAG: lytic murein transglycosylase B [Burkholderiaceae bacterium]|nr:lytic murein transglycosylase B [Burkholderiaceae bacterium]
MLPVLLALFTLALPASGSAQAGPRAGETRAGESAAAASGYAERPDVRNFIDEMVAQHGFATSELSTLFTQARYSADAVRLISPAAPTFKRSWHAYRARFLDALRIREGLRFWSENEAWLAFASALYGVPPEIVVAIIGVETIYGRITGNFRVLDVLSTLAFDYPPRAPYFRSELEQYLLFTRESAVDPAALRGSFAGAMGLPQFMPGSIRRFAVDLDGDGHIDLQSNPADAIGSVASFLAQHGWRSGEPVRFTMRAESEQRLAPLIEAGIEPRYTLDELAAYGVSATEAVPAELPLALIDLPNADAPASYYLGAPNFYVITRYNRSSFYAMAVYELSRALLAGR